MPLSQTQAIEPNIVKSLVSYLNMVVVVPYNNWATTSTFKNTLGIALSYPDDPTQIPVLPVIVIEKPQMQLPPEETGIGDGTQYEYWDFRLGCYPALTNDGRPDHTSDAMLRSYMRAFSRAKYVPLLDFTKTNPPAIEMGEIMQQRFQVPQGRPNDILAYEKNLFYMHFTLKIPVVDT